MFSRARTFSWLVCLAISWAVLPAFAQGSEKTLHVFSGTPDGTYPLGGLTADGVGNFFGTTQFGGASGCGTVFELTPDGNGGLSYKLVYTLTGGADGAFPQGQVAVDGAEHLYVTTVEDDIAGTGTVFELVPDKNGNFNLGKTFLFNGVGKTGSDGDGAQPQDGVTVDAAGNLFGTARIGGDGNARVGFGTVFELTPAGDHWNVRTLHRFNGGSDGAFPFGGLVVDRNGDLYGTAPYGGDTKLGLGLAFRMHEHNGIWTKTTIHSFTPSEGSNPETTMSFDRAGNLYGTANGALYRGPKEYVGSVFKLARPSHLDDASPQQWPLTTLHAFTGAADGGGPSQIVLDSAGNIYGTTGTGGDGRFGSAGCPGGCGVIYRLVPALHGAWTDNVLWTFTGGLGGEGGFGPLAFGRDGRLYGTTAYGGLNSYPVANGIVFSSL